MVPFGFQTGNVLSCKVMWSERHTSSICLLLIVLAVADSSVIVTWTTVNAVPPFCAVWRHCSAMLNAGPFLFSYGIAIGSLAHFTSIYTVVLVALQRLIAVKIPMRAKSLNRIGVTRVQILGMLLFTSAFCAPRFAERYIGVHPMTGLSTALTRPFADSYAYRVVYKVILYNLFYFGLPLSFLAVVTYNLAVALRKSWRLRSMMTSHASKEQDTTLTLTTVVLVFLATQIVNPIRRVLIEVLSDDQKLCGSGFFYLHHLVPVFVMMNSSCNFLIYCVCNKRFRTKFLQLFRRNRVAPAPGPPQAGMPAP